MKVLLDHREGAIADIVREAGGQVETVSLPLADIMTIGDRGAVAVERKTVVDFVSSIRSNRIWEQLLRFMKTDVIMGHKIVRRILVVHGSFDQYVSGLGSESWSKFWGSIMGAFMEVLFVYDTPLLIAQDDMAFAAFLRILLKREERGANDKLPSPRWFRRHVPADLPTKNRKLYVIDSIPLIGESQAKALLEHFGTIENIARASPEELQNVPGVGRKKAKLIHATFH